MPSKADYFLWGVINNGIIKDYNFYSNVVTVAVELDSFNTTSKYIAILGFLFTDFDEVDKKDTIEKPTIVATAKLK